MPEPDKPLEEIIRDLKGGRDREENFRLLFLRHQAQVYRFFLANRLPPEDSRDLTQEVFFSVYKGLMNLQGENQFAAWLFTIARNTFANYIEKRHAAKREGIHLAEKRSEEDAGAFDLDTLPATGRGANALDELLDREKTGLLRDALEKLPGQMRRCVQMRVGEECPYEEIAVVMGISVNTVKAHLFQARRLLRERLEPVFGDVEI